MSSNWQSGNLTVRRRKNSTMTEQLDYILKSLSAERLRELLDHVKSHKVPTNPGNLKHFFQWLSKYNHRCIDHETVVNIINIALNDKLETSEEKEIEPSPNNHQQTNCYEDDHDIIHVYDNDEEEFADLSAEHLQKTLRADGPVFIPKVADRNHSPRPNQSILCDISDLLHHQIADITAHDDFNIEAFATQILGQDSSHDVDKFIGKNDNLATQCPNNDGNQSPSNKQGRSEDLTTINATSPSRSPNDKNNSNDGNDERDKNGDDEEEEDAPIQYNELSARIPKAPRAVLKARPFAENPAFIEFDASESKDGDGYACSHFVFDFGDRAPVVLITTSIISRAYFTSGAYTATVVVQDKYGQSDQASIKLTINIPTTNPTTSSSASIYSPATNTQRLSGNNNRNKSKSSNNGKAKKRKRNKKSKPVLEPNYSPASCSFRAIGNIQTPRSFTEKIIPSRIDVSHIKRLFTSYMDKLTALQWDGHDDDKYGIGDQKALDYDFSDEKTDEHLYCVATRQSIQRGYEWCMESKLYNASELRENKILPPAQCKTPPKSLNTNVQQLESQIRDKLNKILTKKPMNKMVIYNKQNIKKDDEIVWPLRYEKFKEYCKNNKDWKCIPIVMSYDNIENAIQYLAIIQTEETRPDIGISVKYDSMCNSSIFITGIHLDKESILEQHQLAMPHKHNVLCNCLDSWTDNTNITHLIFGDKNHFKYEAERLKKQLEAMNDPKIPPASSYSIVSLGSCSIPVSASVTNSVSSSSQYGVQGYTQYTLTSSAEQHQRQ